MHKSELELNRLVANRVMAWFYNHKTSSWICPALVGGEPPPPRPYCSDLAAAMEVVEKLRELGCCSFIFSWGDDTNAWECSIIMNGKRFTFAHQGLATAICVTAIKWSEHQEGKKHGTRTAAR